MIQLREWVEHVALLTEGGYLLPEMLGEAAFEYEVSHILAHNNYHIITGNDFHLVSDVFYVNGGFITSWKEFYALQ